MRGHGVAMHTACRGLDVGCCCMARVLHSGGTATELRDPFTLRWLDKLRAAMVSLSCQGFMSAYRACNRARLSLGTYVAIRRLGRHPRCADGYLTSCFGDLWPVRVPALRS